MNTNGVNIEGFGTTFYYGNASNVASSTSWTAFGELVDIEPPEADVKDIKRTHMSSPGHAEQYQPGLIEGGEVKAKIHFDTTTYPTIYGLLRKPTGYRIQLSDGQNGVAANGTKIEFDGYMKKCGPKTPMEDIVTCDLAFKVSGLPTNTAGT